MTEWSTNCYNDELAGRALNGGQVPLALDPGKPSEEVRVHAEWLFGLFGFGVWN